MSMKANIVKVFRRGVGRSREGKMLWRWVGRRDGMKKSRKRRDGEIEVGEDVKGRRRKKQKERRQGTMIYPQELRCRK